MFDITEWLALHEAAGGNFRLAYHHQPAEGAARGIILVLHGLADHSRRYRDFALAMSRHGYHVYAHDHRGHGESLSGDAPLGRFARRDGYRAVLDDIAAMRRHLASRHPGLPILLFGHSMGGMLALDAAIAAPQDYQALAVWNSGFGSPAARRAGDIILRIEQALKGSDVPSLMAIRMTFDRWAAAIPKAKTRFDWLSRDEGAVSAYMADPLCGFDPSVSMWRDILRLSALSEPDRALARLPRDLPVHLLAGDGDPSTEGGKSVQHLAERLKRLGMPRITCRIVPGMRHETLHEIGAEAEIAGFGQWCDASVSAMGARGAYSR